MNSVLEAGTGKREGGREGERERGREGEREGKRGNVTVGAGWGM